MERQSKKDERNTLSPEINRMELIRKERIKKLQKKKEVGPVDSIVETFIVDILYGEKWQAGYLDNLIKSERCKYISFLEGALNILAFEDRDRFIDQIGMVLNQKTLNNIWEAEHVSIVNALDSITRQKNRFAARCEVSEKTGYSLPTVDRHIAEYFQSTNHAKKQEEMLLMRERLLSRCYLLGTGGNMKAARLFLESTANPRPIINVHKEQNNFIQVNNLTITEDHIQQLPEERRHQMREILTLIFQVQAL